MLESLDLNIGFESIQKLQDDWFKPTKKAAARDMERDSLDSDEGPAAKETNQEWLEKSIKQSVCQWK